MSNGTAPTDRVSKDDSIVCRVCGGTFVEPVLLDCGHSVCAECAATLISFERFSTATVNNTPVADSLRRTESSRVPCPVCSQTTVIGKEGLKPNPTIRAALDKILADGTRTKCGNECGKQASIDCLGCKTSLCDECFKFIHNKGVYSRHKQSAVGSINVKRSRMCPKHYEKRKLFCQECKTSVCFMCASYDVAHNGHRCVPLTELLESFRAELKKGVLDMATKRSEFVETEVRIDSVTANIKKITEQAETEVRAEFEKLAAAIEQRKQHLLHKINSLRTTKVTRLAAQAKAVREASNQMEAVIRRVNTALNETDNVAGLLNAKLQFDLISQHVQDLHLQPCEEARLHMVFTSSPEAVGQPLSDVIQHYGFVRTVDIPRRIHSLKLTHNTATSMKITWSAPTDDGGEPIRYYRLELAGPLSAESESLFKEVYRGNEQQTELADLKPCSEFKLRVLSANALGESEWSEVLVVTTDKSVPYAPVELKAVEKSNNSLKLSWLPPPEDGGSPVTSYRLQVAPSTGTERERHEFKDIYEGRENEFLLIQLRPYTTYVFRVLARNSIGEGVWSQSVSLTTDKAYVQGIPSKPLPLELLRKSITSLTLGVHPCQSDGGEAIKAYRIFLARVPDELNLAEGVIRTTTDLTLKFEEVFTGLPHEDQGVRFVKLEAGLKPNTTYAVKLQALNSIGYSEWSDVCAFTTNKGKEFKYHSDFDTNGVMYYLGTDEGKSKWVNPNTIRKVWTSRSSDDEGSAGDTTGRDILGPCDTRNEPNSWYLYYLPDKRLLPTHYTLRADTKNNYFLRNWQLQGSSDGHHWITLRIHENDASLNAPKASASWPIVGAKSSYCYFRVLQTGHNSYAQSDRMSLGGFEIYGILDER